MKIPTSPLFRLCSIVAIARAWYRKLKIFKCKVFDFPISTGSGVQIPPEAYFLYVEEKMNLKSLTILILIFCSVIITSCKKDVPLENEKYCSSDTNCACGTHKETGDCFFGNIQYVNTMKQCPDFCTGIAGNLQLKCINNTCRQVMEKRR